MHEEFVYNSVSWSRGDPKDYVVREIQQKCLVLDVGCGVGGFGKWLIDKKKCKVDGIDGHPDAVKEAKKNLNNGHLLDLNDLNQVKDFVKGKSYDAITFIDVLEHCYHPKQLLGIFSQALSEKGRIIVSLPNIAHYSARIRVLKGNFDYDDSGLFDRTHVKFYTRKTSRELIESAGLRVIKEMNTSPTQGWKKALSKIDPTLTAIQFVMVASK